MKIEYVCNKSVYQLFIKILMLYSLEKVEAEFNVYAA